MNKYFDILQNQFHEITISLDRTDLIQCDGNWHGNEGRPLFSSIGLICGGTGTIIVNGQEMHPVQDQLYLIPAHSVLTFFNDGTQPYLKYYCHFNIKLHDMELFDIINVPLCVTPKDPAVAAALFENMIAAHHEKSISSLIKARQYMMELVCHYLQCCEEPNIALVENASDSAINKAIAYAESHLGGSVSVAEMAEIAGYHPSHFTILFKNRFGVSPARFIVQKKTHFAIEQLTGTNRPIADISSDLGFSSQFYFCSFFKRQTGMTPSEYRHVYLKK